MMNDTHCTGHVDYDLMKFEVWCRKGGMVNTDPQRRCYNGCNFSEEFRWGEWYTVCRYASLEDAADSVRTFKAINPGREYEIRNGG